MLNTRMVTSILCRFNSTTVQLILAQQAKLTIEVALFQFHNGTINTREDRKNTGFLPLFQFHNGTINTIFPCLASTAKILFQFHNGTINTYLEVLSYKTTYVSIPQRYN